MSGDATLGIWDGHDASVSLVVDGALVFALSEERPSRIKRFSGFPRRALAECVRWAERHGHRIAEVAIAGNWGRAPLRVLEAAYSSGDPQRDPLTPASRLVRAWENGVAALPVIRHFERADGLSAVRRRIRSAVGETPRLATVGHHEAHAWAALFGATEEPGLVVTWDAYGEGVAVTARPAGFPDRPTHRLAPNVGLARLYGAITVELGFGEGDEGKVMGLAAHGDPTVARKRLTACLTPRRGGPRLTKPLTRRAVRDLVAGLPREDVAAGLQELTERVVTAWVRRRLLDSPVPRRLLLAGGIFANIRLNQALAELPEVSGVSVFPNMGDGGLSAGAAARASYARTATALWALDDVFLGPHPDAARLDRIAGEAGGARVTDPAATAAAHLRAGRVVCRYVGRDEFGPRALGHRSVLFAADDPSRGARVNRTLGRDSFMPFGPAVAADHASAHCPSPLGERDLAFMTVSTDADATFAGACPGAVHVDGSTRPQVVTQRSAPDLAKLLAAYRSDAHPPALINTSFNLHGEPIVHTPDDALSTFRRSGLDVLMLGDWEIVRRW